MFLGTGCTHKNKTSTGSVVQTMARFRINSDQQENHTMAQIDCVHDIEMFFIKASGNPPNK
jgi:hypothetical protein